MNRPLLSAHELHRSYPMGHENVRVLRGTSLQVAAGEFLVIMGSSGSGKSTLLHVLGALDRPDRGVVEFRGRNVFGMTEGSRRDYRNSQVGFVFQFYHLLPELTILENVMVPRFIRHSLRQWFGQRRQARRDSQEIIERVGLAPRAGHRPNQLSGGERQRVAIARALVNRPLLLLADEPTGNLDEAIGAEILSLLTELNESGQTIVMVTHDAKVASHAHRRVQLTEGVIRETGGSSARSAAPLAMRKVVP